jgi:hypothetical protein
MPILTTTTHILPSTSNLAHKLPEYIASQGLTPADVHYLGQENDRSMAIEL